MWPVVCQTMLPGRRIHVLSFVFFSYNTKTVSNVICPSGAPSVVTLSTKNRNSVVGSGGSANTNKLTDVAINTNETNIAQRYLDKNDLNTKITTLHM